MSQSQTLDTAAADYIVQARFDPATLELKLSVTSLAVLPGSNVLIQFENLPPGWSPLTEFRNPAGNTIMAGGPFEQLIIGRQQIVGLNAQSDIDRYDFRCLIQRGFGAYSVNDAAVIFGQWLSFELQADPADGRVVEVQVMEREGELVVDHPQITIKEGLRVRWNFEQVARDYHQPMIVYGRPLVSGSPVATSGLVSQEFFGPHESFSYSGNRIVEGNGNNGIPGIYRYGVYLLDVRSRFIAIESSSDPQTDNEGDSNSTGPSQTEHGNQ